MLYFNVFVTFLFIKSFYKFELIPFLSIETKVLNFNSTKKNKSSRKKFTFYWRAKYSSKERNAKF